MRVARSTRTRSSRGLAILIPVTSGVVGHGVVLAERDVRSKQLAEYVGITEANLSLLKQGKVGRQASERARRQLRSAARHPAPRNTGLREARAP